MNEKPSLNEVLESANSKLKVFLKETFYHLGNVGYFLQNIANVIIRLKVKILGLIMLGVPALYFDEGKALILNLVHSVANKGFVDIFILFAVGSIIITWCSFAIYFIIFK